MSIKKNRNRGSAQIRTRDLLITAATEFVALDLSSMLQGCQCPLLAWFIYTTAVNCSTTELRNLLYHLSWAWIGVYIYEWVHFHVNNTNKYLILVASITKGFIISPPTGELALLLTKLPYIQKLSTLITKCIAEMKSEGQDFFQNCRTAVGRKRTRYSMPFVPFNLCLPGI